MHIPASLGTEKLGVDTELHGSIAVLTVGTSIPPSLSYAWLGRLELATPIISVPKSPLCGDFVSPMAIAGFAGDGLKQGRL